VICVVGAKRLLKGAAQPRLRFNELDKRPDLCRKPHNAKRASHACECQACCSSYQRRHGAGNAVHRRRLPGAIRVRGPEAVFKFLDDPDKLGFWCVFVTLDHYCPERGIHDRPADRVLAFQGGLDGSGQLATRAAGNSFDPDMDTPVRSPKHARQLRPERRLERADSPSDCPDEPRKPWHCWPATPRASQPCRSLPVGRPIETRRSQRRAWVSFAHLDMVSTTRPAEHHPTW
jgi:hypothetical protein